MEERKDKDMKLIQSVSLWIFLTAENLRANIDEMEDENLRNLARDLIEKLDEADAVIYEATGLYGKF